MSPEPQSAGEALFRVECPIIDWNTISDNAKRLWENRADAAIAWYRSHSAWLHERMEQAMKVDKLAFKVIEENEKLVAAQKGGWVSCSERMPTREDADVEGRLLWLAPPAKDGVRYCYWMPFDWGLTSQCDGYDWMSIPPPPPRKDPFNEWFRQTDIAANARHEPIYETIAKRAWDAATVAAREGA